MYDALRQGCLPIQPQEPRQGLLPVMYETLQAAFIKLCAKKTPTIFTIERSLKNSKRYMGTFR